MSAHLHKAEKLFETFHQFDPEDVGSFRKGFKIPKQAWYVGEAKTMYYTSDKLNPISGEDEGWISYYHPHEGNVRLYVSEAPDEEIGELRNIPKWIHDTKALTRLGDCEGFDFIDLEGNEREAKATKPYPEWYAIPSGKALLVIQSKRDVLAIIWGGDLDVEWRGVVG